MSDTAFNPHTRCASAAPRPSAAIPAPPLPTPALASQIALANGLAEPVAFIDPDGRIVAVNRAWTRNAMSGATCSLVPGDNYLDFLCGRSRAGIASATSLIAILTRTVEGDWDTAEQQDLVDRDINGRVYRVLVTACPVGLERWHMIARYDRTELITLRRRSRRLARHRLGAEEAERRRVARDLHDGTAQDLVALQLALGSLRRNASAAVASDLVGVDEALAGLQREIRSLALLYHPPMLDERGLVWALRAMIEGFGRRANLRIRMLLDYASRRVTVREATLYRVAQEALANVHRHARAGQVHVSLIKARGALHLLVRDDGIGLDVSGAGNLPMGVGFAAMNERVRDVGGRLVVRSGRKGTSVMASVPLAGA